MNKKKKKEREESVIMTILFHTNVHNQNHMPKKQKKSTKTKKKHINKNQIPFHIPQEIKGKETYFLYRNSRNEITSRENHMLGL
jgi:hypothetical protein